MYIYIYIIDVFIVFACLDDSGIETVGSCGSVRNGHTLRTELNKLNNLVPQRTSLLQQHHYFLNQANHILVQWNLHINTFVCAQEILCHI